MAIAGSTRLQASTVLMLAAGAALFSSLPGSKTATAQINDFTQTLQDTDFTPLCAMIEAESEIYRLGHLCQHETTRYGITVLTDTTERSPTFSLLPFENRFDEKAHFSWTYLSVPGTTGAADSWRHILKRSPRALAWDGFKDFYGEERLHGFDFSPQSLTRRQAAHPQRNVNVFRIDAANGNIEFNLGSLNAQLPQPSDLLAEHLLLKCALNFSSTLVMGRMNRFDGNLMLFVRPTNKKLIDRSIRFIDIMLRQASIQNFSYEAICQALFETIAELPADQSVVIKTYEKLLALRTT